MGKYSGGRGVGKVVGGNVNALFRVLPPMLIVLVLTKRIFSFPASADIAKIVNRMKRNCFILFIVNDCTKHCEIHRRNPNAECFTCK